MTRAALLLLALAAASPAWPVQPPQRVEMDFSVSSGSMELGEGHDVLVHDGKEYSVTSEMKTVGVAALLFRLNIRREARGMVTPAGLRPLHFEEERTRKPARAADFDWAAKTIKLTDGENVQTLPLPENTYDQTSFTYAFAFKAPPATMPTVYLTDGRKLSDYNYAMVGRETLKTAMGELETLHYKKVQEADDKRGFEVWFAPAHHNLPVRIRYVEKNGQVVDSTITRITYR
jgi:hypothetical protein